MKRLVTEFIGTAMLLAAVVGSGIMAERLSGGNIAVALLANTIATGAALLALIFSFGPISGAHFNPVITLAAALSREFAWRDVGLYLPMQFLGAIFGVGIANLMFDLPLLFASTKQRTGFSQWLGEFVATFGLIAVIHSCSRLHKSFVIPVVVAAYITAAYWFTSSTSFANPAVTVARSMSDTFTGIRPIDVPGFVAAQFLGALAATITFRWLVPVNKSMKKKVLILCTGNSARSQMAEAYLRHMGSEKFDVYSAGISPSLVRPEAIAALEEIGVATDGLRSKSAEEFTDQQFDYIITVCDNAKETCPVFPGNATRIHWSFDDPAAVEGSEEERLSAFRRIREQLIDKLNSFAASLTTK